MKKRNLLKILLLPLSVLSVSLIPLTLTSCFNKSSAFKDIDDAIKTAKIYIPNNTRATVLPRIDAIENPNDTDYQKEAGYYNSLYKKENLKDSNILKILNICEGDSIRPNQLSNSNNWTTIEPNLIEVHVTLNKKFFSLTLPKNLNQIFKMDDSKNKELYWSTNSQSFLTSDGLTFYNNVDLENKIYDLTFYGNIKLQNQDVKTLTLSIKLAHIS